MQQVNNDNHPAESGNGHSNKGDRLTKRDVIGGVVLVIFVAGALSGYYAFNYISKDSARMQFWVTFMFSFAAFVVLLVQSVIYAQQAEFMRKQWDVMERQWQAVKEQNAVIEKSIDTANLDSIFANRAYVTAKIRGTGEGSHQWRLRIENSGNTPAKNVCVYYSCEFGEIPPWDAQSSPFREMPEDQIVFDTVLHHTERLGVIAPNNSYHIIRTPKVAELSPEDRKKWLHGDIKFFCWGVIVYEDIFSKKRYTYFCFFESQKHPNGYPCEHGNSAN